MFGFCKILIQVFRLSSDSMLLYNIWFTKISGITKIILYPPATNVENKYISFGGLWYIKPVSITYIAMLFTMVKYILHN